MGKGGGGGPAERGPQPDGPAASAGGRARARWILQDSGGTTAGVGGVCLGPHVQPGRRLEMPVGGEEAGRSGCWLS